MYEKIYNFCKVRNKGNCFKNGSKPTPRVNFITDLCGEMGLDYEMDSFSDETSDEYRIQNFRSIEEYIASDKLDLAKSIYSEFKEKLDLLYKNRASMNDFDELDDEYTQKLRDAVGNLEMERNMYFNIMLPGDSDKWVVAHHDINNPTVDNANDNSCSVINALMIKKLRPDVNVVILDGEEFGGIGSDHLSKKIKEEELPCKWVLNLELTGRGGKNFFVGSMGNQLTEWIANRFECPVVNVPFNDSIIFKKHGINSTVVNPLPITEVQGPIVNKDGQYLDFKMLFNCHTPKDTVETIDPNDMKEFVEEICLKIIDEA